MTGKMNLFIYPIQFNLNIKKEPILSLVVPKLIEIETFHWNVVLQNV